MAARSRPFENLRRSSSSRDNRTIPRHQRPHPARLMARRFMRPRECTRPLQTSRPSADPRRLINRDPTIPEATALRRRLRQAVTRPKFSDTKRHNTIGDRRSTRAGTPGVLHIAFPRDRAASQSRSRAALIQDLSTSAALSPVMICTLAGTNRCIGLPIRWSIIPSARV